MIEYKDLPHSFFFYCTVFHNMVFSCLLSFSLFPVFTVISEVTMSILEHDSLNLDASAFQECICKIEKGGL